MDHAGIKVILDIGGSPAPDLAASQVSIGKHGQRT